MTTVTDSSHEVLKIWAFDKEALLLYIYCKIPHERKTLLYRGMFNVCNFFNYYYQYSYIKNPILCNC